MNKKKINMTFLHLRQRRVFPKWYEKIVVNCSKRYSNEISKHLRQSKHIYLLSAFEKKHSSRKSIVWFLKLWKMFKVHIKGKNFEITLKMFKVHLKGKHFKLYCWKSEAKMYKSFQKNNSLKLHSTFSQNCMGSDVVWCN